jgi:hypothetical protein
MEFVRGAIWKAFDICLHVYEYESTSYIKGSNVLLFFLASASLEPYVFATWIFLLLPVVIPSIFAPRTHKAEVLGLRLSNGVMLLPSNVCTIMKPMVGALLFAM